MLRGQHIGNTMSDIFNLIVHLGFFLVGIGVGISVGISMTIFKNLALDATHKIEHSAMDAAHRVHLPDPLHRDPLHRQS